MFFVPNDYADAEILAERIAIRLQHANSAVVLTSTKVILYLMNYIASSEFRESLCKKLSPPLGEQQGKTETGLCGRVILTSVSQ
jgi:AP-2 complex subunit beta-1